MRQQQIDELLESSSDQQMMRKNKKKQKQQKKRKQQRKQERQRKEDQQRKGESQSDQYDQFFQSQHQGDQAFNKKPSQAIRQQKLHNQIKASRSKANKVPPKVSSQVEEQEYLDSQDFQSQVQRSQKVAIVKKQRSVHQKGPSQPKRSQMSDIGIPRGTPAQRRHANQSEQSKKQEQAEYLQQEDLQQPQSLVNSQYQQSQNISQEQINEQEMVSQRMQQVQTIQSSLMKSHQDEDEMSQAQSEFIQSTRINQQMFRKNNPMQPNESTQSHLKQNQQQFKKKPAASEEPNKSGNKGTVKKVIRKQVTNQNQPKKEKAIPEHQQQDKQQPDDLSTKHLPQKKKSMVVAKKAQRNKLSQGQLQKQKQRQQRLQKIQAQRKVLQLKKNSKLNQKKQQAKLEYQQMKQKQEQRKQKNKKIMQQQNKKKSGEGSRVGNGIKGMSTTAMKQLDLTESRVKQLAAQEQKKRAQKTEMKATNQMRAKRKRQQEQGEKRVQMQNRQKIKKLQYQKQNYFQKTQQAKQQFQVKKQQALSQKKQIQQNMVKQRGTQNQQKQTLEGKQLRQQNRQLKLKNQQKLQSILNLDQAIQGLKKQLKRKQKIKFNSGDCNDQKQLGQQSNDIDSILEDRDSERTPVERFVRLFQHQCQTTQQIFSLIDYDKDGLLTLQEIKSKITQILLQKSPSFKDNDLKESKIIQENNQNLQILIDQVYKLLDKNYDGSITREQFSFIIDSQIKKVKQYRKMMGNMQHTTPLNMQAKILDMKEKTKYMDSRIRLEINSEKMNQLQDKYQKYLKKHQEYEKKIMHGKMNRMKQAQKDQGYSLDDDLKHDKLYFMGQQVQKLSLKKKNQQKMLQKISIKQEQNIKQKNLHLCQKVQQNIKLNQQIYKIKLQIQQSQLRFLSIKKMEQNRHRYQIHKSQQQKLYEQSIQKAKQYRMKILNPSNFMSYFQARQIRGATYANQVQYLAAVIIIQRNFRRTRAMREKQRRMGQHQNH